MSAKEFFKSTAFKCIAVLLTILLVCGILLTVCNSLFYVSAEEKFDRAIKKIYGTTVATTEIDLDGHTVNFETASVNEAYLVEDDGNYLIKATGKQGFGGDVTCWVVVKTNDDGTAVTGVGNIAIDKAAGESYVSKIDKSELAHFSELEYESGFVYELGKDGKDYIKTGASYTMRAISNAVNGAVEFINVYLGGTASVNPYEGLPHSEFISSTTTYSVSGAAVSYAITTQVNGSALPFKLSIKVELVGEVATITEYSITKNGSTTDNGTEYKDKMATQAKNLTGRTLAEVEAYLADTTAGGALKTGATNSNTHCYEAAAFALANYSAFVAGGAQ